MLLYCWNGLNWRQGRFTHSLVLWKSIISTWGFMKTVRRVHQLLTNCDPGPQNQSLGYICSNSQKYIVWVKIIDFYFMPKIIRTLSKKICSIKIFSKFPTVNISKRNFWLVMCIVKNFIWTILKANLAIFRFFLHPQIPDFKYLYLDQRLSHHNKQWNVNLLSFQIMYKS